MKKYILGGLISIIIGMILTLILLPFGCSGEYIKICYWQLPFKFGALPIVAILKQIIFFKANYFFEKNYIIIPAGILNYFLIGVIIVYLKNKFKRRNKNGTS